MNVSKVSGVWRTIAKMIRDIVKININITVDVIFGFYNDEDRKLWFIGNLFFSSNQMEDLETQMQCQNGKKRMK